MLLTWTKWLAYLKLHVLPKVRILAECFCTVHQALALSSACIHVQVEPSAEFAALLMEAEMLEASLRNAESAEVVEVL